MSGADPDVQRRVTAMIDRQVTHMVRLVDDLLEVSRIGRGKIELRKGLVDMSAVVRSALETSAAMIEGAGHQITVGLPAEPAWIQADPVRLAQVVGNLLINAAKYTEPGGAITVSCMRQGKNVVLSVRDTGSPAEMLPRVFDLFTQIDSTVGRAQGGLGTRPRPRQVSRGDARRQRRGAQRGDAAEIDGRGGAHDVRRTLRAHRDAKLATKAVGFDAHLVKPVAGDSLVELLGSVPVHRLRG